MSVLTSDIMCVGSANMPEVDGVTTGGAIDATKRIMFNDITPSGTVNYVSSSASDTASTITATGRDGTGVIVAETKTLTGQAPVSGTQTFERLEKGVAGGTAAVGDIAVISNTAVVTGTAQAGAAASASTPASATLASGAGASCSVGQVLRITNNSPSGAQYQLRLIIALSGDVASVDRDWAVVPSSATTYAVHRGMLFPVSPVQVTQVRRPFYGVLADVSGGTNFTYYEKVFWVNWNASTALSSAAILKQSDPAGATNFQFALCNSLNDTATVTNRKTAPTGITSLTAGSAPQSIAVPSPGNLGSGSAPNAANAQGVWMALQLNAGLAAAKVSFTLRATGTTT